MKVPKNLEPIICGLSAAVVIAILAFLTFIFWKAKKASFQKLAF